MRPSDLHPDQIRYRTPEEVSALLGPPTVSSVRGMATLWEYRGKDCPLFLSFYPEVPGNKLRLFGIETEGGISLPACLGRWRDQGQDHGK